ncbi:MAG TPA: RNB domain-containing ribonuclease [Glaciibacter sp.]|nr:RNB domain-containing ribonuclease [Glaciibacter sp.]
MMASLLRLQHGLLTEELSAALAAIPVRFGLTRSFPLNVEAEAEEAARLPLLPDLDYTGVPFLTIDPAGAADLDQAIHIDQNGDGFRLLYAIADVPAFVSPGGSIDAEARRRGQTVYAPDGRIPLHPTRISEGAASLLPGRTRSAYVWDFSLDAACVVSTVVVSRARIRSRRQYSYAEAQHAIDDGSGPPTLLLLRRVGIGRIRLEQERGGASLRIPSVDIESGDEGNGGYRLVRRSPLAVEDWNAQISLMTGMAAGELMLNAGIGILRTMPPPEGPVVDAFRRQAEALGHPWPVSMPYGEYLRRLDSADPHDLAIMHAAGSLFRGAGYTAFDGVVPSNPLQAAVAAPYAHVTAPLRRLVDRFALVTCASLSATEPVPHWVRGALPELPAVMATSERVAGNVDNAGLDAIEAAALSRHVGETFDATVISAGNGRGQIQLTEPAVTAPCTGPLEPGSRIRAKLTEATIATGTIRFELAARRE